MPSHFRVLEVCRLDTIVVAAVRSPVSAAKMNAGNGNVRSPTQYALLL